MDDRYRQRIRIAAVLMILYGLLPVWTPDGYHWVWQSPPRPTIFWLGTGLLLLALAHRLDTFRLTQAAVVIALGMLAHGLSETAQVLRFLSMLRSAQGLTVVFFMLLVFALVLAAANRVATQNAQSLLITGLIVVCGIALLILLFTPITTGRHSRIMLTRILVTARAWHEAPVVPLFMGTLLLYAVIALIHHWLPKPDVHRWLNWLGLLLVILSVISLVVLQYRLLLRASISDIGAWPFLQSILYVLTGMLAFVLLAVNGIGGWLAHRLASGEIQKPPRLSEAWLRNRLGDALLMLGTMILLASQWRLFWGWIVSGHGPGEALYPLVLIVILSLLVWYFRDHVIRLSATMFSVVLAYLVLELVRTPYYMSWFPQLYQLRSFGLRLAPGFLYTVAASLLAATVISATALLPDTENRHWRVLAVQAISSLALLFTLFHPFWETSLYGYANMPGYGLPPQLAWLALLNLLALLAGLTLVHLFFPLGRLWHWLASRLLPWGGLIVWLVISASYRFWRGDYLLGITTLINKLAGGLWLLGLLIILACTLAVLLHAWINRTKHGQQDATL